MQTTHGDKTLIDYLSAFNWSVSLETMKILKKYRTRKDTLPMNYCILISKKMFSFPSESEERLLKGFVGVGLEEASWLFLDCLKEMYPK